MKRYISILVLVVLVIALGIGIIFCGNKIVQKNNEIVKLNQENKDLKDTINTLNDTIEKIQDNSQDNNISINYNFDESKVENKKDGETIIEDISQDNGTISASVDTIENNVYITLDSKMANLVYGYNGQDISKTLVGFNNKVIDIKIGIDGEASNDLKVVMLMNDGAVKYVTIADILNGSFNIKTLNADRYVKISKVIIKDEVSQRSGFVGIKLDGSAKIIEFPSASN